MQHIYMHFYLTPKFEVKEEFSPDVISSCYFSPMTFQNGWDFLQIYTNPHSSLLTQHRGAGFIEGYVTYCQIHSAYKNLEKAIIKKDQVSWKTQLFVDQQTNYLQKMVKNNPGDIFWQYAEAYLQQLRYIYRGYICRIIEEDKSEYYLSFNQFYCLTNVGDLQDLIPAFHDETQMGPNCNGYVKLLKNELYVAHSTHNIYSFLLRMFKTYHFPTKRKTVGSEWMSFSSRPGDLISKDDFYVLSSGLRVIETSFNNFKKENYEKLSAETVPCWLRATIACNLARDNKQWIQYFLKERSGTHNNQWIVVNPKQLSKKEDIVSFVEQGYTKYEVKDMSERFLQRGFLGSYNVPISEEIYHQMGYEKHGYTYENDPRAIIYGKYDKFIFSVEDMKKWLITNEEEDLKVGLAPRYDLAEQPSTFGLTDCKIVGPLSQKIDIISGPSRSNGRFNPFSWKNWPDVSHLGMPQCWDFEWVNYEIVETEKMLK